MGHNWQTGETITAALLNGVAQVGDIGVAGTPTGDALKAAYGLVIAATVTASGTLVAGKHNPVDATAGPLTLTLPTGAVEGATIGVEKLDNSTNAVTVTGNIRGASGQSVSLPWTHETLVLRADSTGSWWPVAGHKTKSSLDAAYASKARVRADVRDYGAKCDLATIASCSVAASSTQLSSTAYTFTSADVGKQVVVLAAGAAYNPRGAYANNTAYAIGDTVTQGTQTLTPLFNAITGDTAYNPNHWVITRAAVPALITTIASVSGGVATLAAPAASTASGVSAILGTDDTAAHQAAIDAVSSAGGGPVYSPGNTMCRGVFVTNAVQLVLGPGRIMPTPNGTANGWIFRLASKVSGYAVGCSIKADNRVITFDWTGLDPSATLYAPRAHGILVDRAQDWSIEGTVLGVNPTHANVVSLSQASGLRPLRGRIGTVVGTGTPYNFGAIQVDDCSTLEIDAAWSDMGRALNLEADAYTSHLIRLVENVTCDFVQVEARASDLCNAALGLVAHDNIVQDVKIGLVGHRGGQSEAIFTSWDTTVTGAYVDRIHIDKVRVSGGGRATYFDKNLTFTAFHIGDLSVDGANVTDNTGLALPGLEIADGMHVESAEVVRGNTDGISSAGWSAPPGRGGIGRIGRVRVHSNAGYGVINQTLDLLEIDRGTIIDQPFQNLLTADHRDGTVGGNGWLNTTSGTGTTLAQDKALTWSRALIFGAPTDGSSSAALIRSDKNVYAVTEGSWVAFVLASRPVGPKTLGRRFTARLTWYTTAGTSPGIVDGTVKTQQVGAWTTAYVVAQVPTGQSITYVAPTFQITPGGTGTGLWASGEKHAFVPLGYGAVSGPYAGTARQTNAFRASLGCNIKARSVAAFGHASGRFTGSGVLLEDTPRDPEGLTNVFATATRSFGGAGVPLIDVTGLTSAQIDALLTRPQDGDMLLDPSGLVLVRVAGKWSKSAAFTQIA